MPVLLSELESIGGPDWAPNWNSFLDPELESKLRSMWDPNRSRIGIGLESESSSELGPIWSPIRCPNWDSKWIPNWGSEIYGFGGRIGIQIGLDSGVEWGSDLGSVGGRKLGSELE